MKNIQQVFNNILAIKKKQKDIKEAYRDALSTSQAYQDIKEKATEIRDKKKQIENSIKESFSSEFTKLDDLKIDLESEQEMLTDIAITTMMKGESVEIKDEYDNDYEPVFKVNFKKVN